MTALTATEFEAWLTEPIEPEPHQQTVLLLHGGFSESDALLINVLSGALSIGACLVTVLLIDRL